jgi:hypothetical protein
VNKAALIILTLSSRRFGFSSISFKRLPKEIIRKKVHFEGARKIFVAGFAVDRVYVYNSKRKEQKILLEVISRVKKKSKLQNEKNLFGKFLSIVVINLKSAKIYVYFRLQSQLTVK